VARDSPVHYYAVHRIKGFMLVRHFGFLANRCRARCLALIRTALAAPVPESAEAPAVTAPFDGYPCPTCRPGRLHVTRHLAPRRRGQGVMNEPAPASTARRTRHAGQAASGLRPRSPPRWKMVYNRRKIAGLSAPRPPRMLALRRSERCPPAERAPDTGWRPWARGYNSLSLKNIVPAAGTVPGSE
jgi:hypothetical protein